MPTRREAVLGALGVAGGAMLPTQRAVEQVNQKGPAGSPTNPGYILRQQATLDQDSVRYARRYEEALSERRAALSSGGGGFDFAYKAALALNEGGYTDGKDLGEDFATNYGITQRTLDGAKARFPDRYPADVKDLTQEQAREIFKRDYWDANGLDKYSPAFQVYALDTVAQHGRGPALVRAAEGSLTKLHDLRARYLEGLISDDRVKNHDSLRNRLARTFGIAQRFLR